MISRTITIAGFAILFGSAVLMELNALLRGNRLATFGTAVAAVTNRHLLLRVALIILWTWLGWHFLVRTA